jgi:hypothetical protein
LSIPLMLSMLRCVSLELINRDVMEVNMKNLSISLTLWILAPLFAFTCFAQLHDGQHQSFVKLQKVGPIDVHDGQHILLEDSVTDFVGTAGNYKDYDFYVLLRPRGDTGWLVGGSSSSQPGGIFSITGVRLPSAECDAFVALLPAASLRAGSWIDGSEWQSKALATSERVVLKTTRVASQRQSSGDLEAVQSFNLSIVSIGNANVTSAEKVIVPPVSDVMVNAERLEADYKVYLRVRVPYTEKCFVYSGSRDSNPARYVFRDVEFDSPGDPEQANYNLVALASTRPLPVGQVSCATQSMDRILASPTVQVGVNSKRRRVDTGRVPYIAITKVGRQVLDSAAQPRTITVRDGDAVEVGASERMTEGATLTLWVRRRGNSVWLVNGPLLPRGVATAASVEGRSMTWVQPSTRFAAPGPSAENSDEFELMAVLSTAMFPNVWLDSTAVSSHSVETVSEIVTVRVPDPEPPFNARLDVFSAAGQEVDPDRVVGIRGSGAVRIESRDDLPPYVRVYVAGHHVGETAWTVIEAMRNGKTFVVPDFPFDEGPQQRRWQLVAFPSAGALPTRSVGYSEFLPHFAQTSDLAEVSGIARNDTRAASSDASPQANDVNAAINSAGPEDTQLAAGDQLNRQKLENKGRENMSSTLPFALLFIVLLVLLEWLLGAVSVVCSRAAETLDGTLSRTPSHFELPLKVNPGRFLLGCALGGLLVWVLQAHYLRFYTEVIAAVTGLAARASHAWAMYLIVATAITGVLLELSEYLARLRAENQGKLHGIGFFGVINTFLYFAALVIWSYQALLYFEYFQNSGHLIAPLAAAAAFLFSAVETLGFLFATALVVDTAGWLVFWVCVAPFKILAFVLHLLAALFSRRPAMRSKPSQPPLPPPQPIGPQLSSAAGD